MSTVGFCRRTLYTAKELKKKKALVLGLNLDKASFSLILANSFGKQQESSLEDYIQLSVMMQQQKYDNRLLPFLAIRSLTYDVFTFSYTLVLIENNGLV